MGPEPRLNPPDDVLFVGIGMSAVGWYRCYLPAMFMGADWCGLIGYPPNFHFATGLIKRETRTPDFYDYKIVVVQQPSGTRWLGLIRKLQDRGIKVLVEVDDYLHGIRKKDDHDFQKHFDRDYLKGIEMNMRVADGIIVSTEWLGGRYRAFNPNIWVCENGLDTSRYNLTRPPRPTVNIGWAGATGHTKSVVPWLQATASVMAGHEEACFVSIGQPFAREFAEHFGEDRAITIPFTLIEQYPSAMTMFDIALAPAGRGAWYRGKSDLRWIEAGALGIPIIADPVIYPKIDNGVTGFHAEDARDVGGLLEDLILDPDLRAEVGANAQEYVRKHRDMTVMVHQWTRVFGELLSD